MRTAELSRALERVRDIATVAVIAFFVEQTKPCWRFQRSSLPLRIHSAEEKKAVLHDRSSALDSRVLQFRGQRLDGPVHRLVLLPRTLKACRARVTEHRSAQVVRTAF